MLDWSLLIRFSIEGGYLWRNDLILSLFFTVGKQTIRVRPSHLWANMIINVWKRRRDCASNCESNGSLPVRFRLHFGTSLLPEVVKHAKWASLFFFNVYEIHPAPLAWCPGIHGAICVFRSGAVISPWKLSARGGTPTSGKALLSELISREQLSLSISHVCLRTRPGAQSHPTKEQKGEQVGRKEEKSQNSKQGLKTHPLFCAKSLCSRKGSAMARHSKHRQAPWKHGHLAGRRGMRYGTNEADNSLNNDIVSLVCYQRNEDCVWKRQKTRLRWSVYVVCFPRCAQLLRWHKSRPNLEVDWGAYGGTWGEASGVGRERAADMPPGCLLQMPHPGGICRAALQPASFSQWKGPEVKDGKHGQLEHKHKGPWGPRLGFSIMKLLEEITALISLLVLRLGGCALSKQGAFWSCDVTKFWAKSVFQLSPTQLNKSADNKKTHKRPVQHAAPIFQASLSWNNWGDAFFVKRIICLKLLLSAIVPIKPAALTAARMQPGKSIKKGE